MTASALDFAFHFLWQCEDSRNLDMVMIGLTKWPDL